MRANTWCHEFVTGTVDTLWETWWAEWGGREFHAESQHVSRSCGRREHGEFKSQKGDVSGMQQVRRTVVSDQAWDISRVWSCVILVLIYPNDNEKSWEGFEEMEMAMWSDLHFKMLLMGWMKREREIYIEKLGSCCLDNSGARSSRLGDWEHRFWIQCLDFYPDSITWPVWPWASHLSSLCFRFIIC